MNIRYVKTVKRGFEFGDYWIDLDGKQIVGEYKYFYHAGADDDHSLHEILPKSIAFNIENIIILFDSALPRKDYEFEYNEVSLSLTVRDFTIQITVDKTHDQFPALYVKELVVELNKNVPNVVQSVWAIPHNI
jgi:hypothetical protein